ncbi:MAG: hypothetical protein AAB664_00780 [Patescibacteria group bacterium]
MHLVCDFDSTLFNTEKIWSEWLEILVARGVDRTHAIRQMEILNATGWTHHAHALASGIDETAVDELVKNFLAHTKSIGSELVYDDVVPFFKKNRPPHTFSILTYGNEEYQTSKILSTSLQNYFDAIRIAGPNHLKVDHLRTLLEHEATPLVFVDDSPNELNPIVDARLPIKLYRIVRPGAKHDYQHERDDVAWKRIKTIDEIIF